jgi:hypothetical protein
MGTNSKRESIILAVVSAVSSLERIVTVQRRRPTLESLQGVSSTQVPIAAITAGLPVPNRHVSTSGGTSKPGVRSHRRADVFISTLSIELVVYDLLYDDDQYDTRLSDLADDLWSILHADQSWGGLAIGTDIEPEANVAIYDPYLAFKMICRITYKHLTGGI